jgi:hypothetical protein
MTEKPARKRRWLRFSLRTLLVVVVLLSVPLGWFALKMREAERQRRAVEAITEAGGWVRYDWALDESGRDSGRQGPPAPAWLLKLVGEDLFSDIACVHLADFDTSQVAFEYLKGLTSLIYLDLSGTGVTDAGIPLYNAFGVSD